MEAEKLLQELHTKLEDEDSLMEPGGGSVPGAAGGGVAEEEGSEEDVDGDHDHDEATTKEGRLARCLGGGLVVGGRGAVEERGQTCDGCEERGRMGRR